MKNKYIYYFVTITLRNEDTNILNINLLKLMYKSNKSLKTRNIINSNFFINVTIKTVNNIYLKFV